MKQIEDPMVAIKDYYSTIESTINLAGYQIRGMTKPGTTRLESSILISKLAATHLLDQIDKLNPQKMLILGSGTGILPALLAFHTSPCEIWTTDLITTNIELSLLTAQANQLGNLHVFPQLRNPTSFLEDTTGDQFDICIMILPKGRKIARHWLLRAYEMLHRQGVLFLIGAKNEGIQSVAKDCGDMFSSVEILGYKKGHRVYQSTKPLKENSLPEWVKESGLSPNTWREFSFSHNNRSFTLRSLPGVFSFGRVDEGTQLLLDYVNVNEKDRVLDMGCGNGIVGIVAASKFAGEVHLVDNNILALASAHENLIVNNINNAKIIASDLYGSLPNSTYDQILSNPPFHTGKDVDYQIAQVLIAHGYHKLHPGGSLTIVANRFIPYDDLMRKVFNNVRILKQSNRYHVMTSYKRP